MFMTSPHFRVPVPKSLLPKGGTCLQAVSLSACGDWWVLTTEHSVEDAKLQQTTLVSWSTALRKLLEEREGAGVVALQWMKLASDFRGWELAEVEEVWLPAEDELPEEVGTLLFRVASVEWLVNDQGSPAAEGRVGRRRLLTVQPKGRGGT